MKICFICNEYPPGQHGGIGTLTQVLGRALSKAGHSVRVIGIYNSDYSAPNYENDQGVQVWRLRGPVHHGSWLLARLRLYTVVARWARDGLIDLVEAPDYLGPIAFWPRLPIPLVVRCHGSASYFATELGRHLDSLTYHLERWAIKRADAWVGVSRYVADRTTRIFKLNSERAAILYNPIDGPTDTNVFRRDRIPERVVYAGAFLRKKGILSLAAAWPLVRTVRPDAELALYGRDLASDGVPSIQAAITAMLKDPATLGVTFGGHITRAELFVQFESASAAVFPSYAEAFSLAPLEAMICGCPILFSQRTSGPELIDDERNGLLIDPDRPDEIAAGLIRLLSDNDLACRLGAAGRETVLSRYSLDVLLPQNEALYCQAISQFGKMLPASVRIA